MVSRFYQTAAERGSVDGWKHVAAMYMTGEGVPQNEQLARQIISMIRKSGIEG
jgi:TPR repeat protein